MPLVCSRVVLGATASAGRETGRKSPDRTRDLLAGRGGGGSRPGGDHHSVSRMLSRSSASPPWSPPASSRFRPSAAEETARRAAEGSAAPHVNGAGVLLLWQGRGRRGLLH